MRVFRYFVRAYPWQSLAVLLCLLLAALMEGVGISTLLPLLSLATGSSDAETGGLEAGVRAAFGHFGLEPTLGALLAVICIAAWTKALLVLLSRRQVGYTVARVATDLRLDLLSALLSTRWSYYTRQPVGAAANAIATEAHRASRAFEHLALISTHAIEAAVYLGVAIAISWQASVVTVAAALVMFTSLGALVRMSGRAGRRQTTLMKSLLARLTDSLQAVKLLKATGREEAMAPLLAEETRLLNRQLRKRVFAKEALRALQEPLLITMVGAGVFVAIGLLGMPFSAILVLVFTFMRALLKVNSIQSKYQSMVTEASALWSLVSMIEHARGFGERSGGEDAPPLEHEVSLRDVVLHYDGQQLLDHVSLQIPAGRITAIIGPSGSGKTTLVDLVTGLVEPETGQVLVDGVPLTTLDLTRWRRRVGYVPQEMLLLHDSVRVNVTFGDPNLSDADVESALRDSGAWEFVSAMPDGIDSSVGERGALLSGGQRQRISIARALVHRPRLLILDEATAALDAETEAAVWSVVAKLRGRTTVVAISHQPALTGVADRIYHLEDGRVRDVTATRGSREVA
jgi:ATP-binding cassette subfamily C protein